MNAFLTWIAAALTQCWHWLKQTGQRGLVALMMGLLPLSFGLMANYRNLSSANPIAENSLIATGLLRTEARVEDLPVQEDDRRSKMAERRADRQRSGLSWSTATSESGMVLLPTMLEQMGNSAEWNYHTLLPGLVNLLHE